MPAYKRTTKKTAKNSRRTVTHATSGPSTISHSNTSGGVTYTSTSKGGKYYMTRTQRFANGFVERKRIMSSSPKKFAKSRRSKKGSGSDVGTVLAIIIILFFVALLGG